MTALSSGPIRTGSRYRGLSDDKDTDGLSTCKVVEVDFEPIDRVATGESELAEYLIKDAMVRMVDKWAGKIDRREAFQFFFGSDGDDEDEKWDSSLSYWCDVAGLGKEAVRNVATLYYLFPVRLTGLKGQGNV